MTETRYERIAREQAERQAARGNRETRRQKAARRRREIIQYSRRHEDSKIANHIDGYDRDDLGESPDF